MVKLSGYIGLQAAHRIMIDKTNKEEAILHLEKEEDNYANLSTKLSDGHWNNEDIAMIRKLAIKKCKEKLSKYPDIVYNSESIAKLTNDLLKGLGL